MREVLGSENLCGWAIREGGGAGLTLGHSGETETDGIVLDCIQRFSHGC